MNQLQITIPSVCINEIEYVIRVVFGEWLGIPYYIKRGITKNIEITAGRGKLSLNTDFFQMEKETWLDMSTMPALPLKHLSLDSFSNVLANRLHKQFPDNIVSIPVLYGLPNITFLDGEQKDFHLQIRKIYCGIDIFGSIFFMISRYEEAVLPNRDSHDRFTAMSSVAYSEGFLNRPIVNEYVELLWAMMECLWTCIKRKKRHFRILLSHDVDSPYKFAGLPAKNIFKHVVSDIVKRRTLKKAVNNFNIWWAAEKGDYSKDPYNTFDFIMHESEKRFIRSAFYFISDHSAGTIDGRYSIDDPEIVKLLKKIDNHGHEIGLHTSYNSYRNEHQTIREADLLRNAIRRHGIKQKILGGRQHYLRFSIPQTFRNWEEAGLKYDSSLSFADSPGFRCGTCWEYTVYDVLKRKHLTLIERPLIIMERSIISESYLGKGYGEEAFNVFKKLKDQCKKYNGDFSMLWHNSELYLNKQKDFYLSILNL